MTKVHLAQPQIGKQDRKIKHNCKKKKQQLEQQQQEKTTVKAENTYRQ